MVFLREIRFDTGETVAEFLEKHHIPAEQPEEPLESLIDDFGIGEAERERINELQALAIRERAVLKQAEQQARLLEAANQAERRAKRNEGQRPLTSDEQREIQEAEKIKREAEKNLVQLVDNFNNPDLPTLDLDKGIGKKEILIAGGLLATLFVLKKRKGDKDT